MDQDTSVSPVDSVKKDARLIAFYLPQFHPIPENDAWWGKGFTEWSNVVKARPLFSGHYQPHLPADLGFYDLRLPETREAQALLARDYGIHGFCYYHYWFNGKRLLERPLDEMLVSGRPDFPFCLCWANENWTRAWDGLDREQLITQRYGAEDDRRHMRWLATALADRRYIRIDGRPLLLIYRVSQLPNPQRTASIWREEALKLGVGDIFLANVQSLRDDRLDPTRLGLDASVEFQPDWLNLGAPKERTREGATVYDYADVAHRMCEKPAPPYRFFRCVNTGWDNTARRHRDATVIHDSSPAEYERWLDHAIEASTPTSTGERVVFVNAWNEWAEGAHLEPCQKWGRAYLEATRAAVNRTAKTAASAASVSSSITVGDALSERRVAVCVPTYNGGRYLAESIASVLGQSFYDFDLLVVDDCSTDNTRAVVSQFGDPRIRAIWNDTRLGLVGNWNRALSLCRGDYVCLFHQDDIMAPDNLQKKVAFLDEHPTAGLVHSNVAQIGSLGETISEWWYFKPDPADAGLQRGADFFTRLLTGPNIVCCPSVVLRRSVIERVGPFDPSLPFTTDLEMWMRVALSYDIGYLTETLVKYRQHAGGETSNFLGVKELEHRYAAKRVVLSKHADRLPDLPVLNERLADTYKKLALERANESFGRHEHEQARAYLQLAVDLHGEGHNGHADIAYKEWLLHALEQSHGGGGVSLPAVPVGSSEPQVQTFQLELALQRAQQDIDALRKSISWRATKPLRRVFEMMTGAPRGLD